MAAEVDHSQEYPHHAHTILSLLYQQRKARHPLCDVTLDVGGKIFSAHKAVLAANSPYFRSHFASDAQTSVVYLNGLTERGVEVILEYMYVGRLNISIENGLEVNTAASFLHMMEVVADCTHYLAAALQGKRAVEATSQARQTTSLVQTSSQVQQQQTVSKADSMILASMLGGTRTVPSAFRGAPTSREEAMQSVSFALMSQQQSSAAGQARSSTQQLSPVLQATPVLCQRNPHTTEETRLGHLQLPPPSSDNPKQLCGTDSPADQRRVSESHQEDFGSLNVVCKTEEEEVISLSSSEDFSSEMDYHRDLVQGDLVQQEEGGFTSGRAYVRPGETGEEDRPWLCMECGARFKTKRVLQHHFIFRHSEERPFMCTCCQARFKRKCELKRHMYTHTGEKPVPCSLCPASFICRSQLLAHLKSRHSYGSTVGDPDVNSPNKSEEDSCGTS
ncbi:PREDICTED: zinc finger and BTB domain-containing protein 17-like [Branchiostoma belcheri]|uniref:Zinc finger and BTB domain-containing protein 17-like n=1 Tax=Branchiostoma belcheri TaxID=7741 RepID=A0A6P5A8Z2_BRABE|nr:PREDICTED: zinc finger and BTB domain-containing protein 17-like [Branchiostoma belcheri]